MTQRDWPDGKTASILYPYWTHSPWPIPALLRMLGPACLNSQRAGLHPRSTTVYLQLSPRQEVPLLLEDFRDSTSAEPSSRAEFLQDVPDLPKILVVEAVQHFDCPTYFLVIVFIVSVKYTLNYSVLLLLPGRYYSDARRVLYTK